MFSVPLSFGLPRPGITRRTALRSSDFPPHLDISRHLRRGDRLARYDGGSILATLPICFLLDVVLLELLVEVAARRVDHFRRLGDVPVVFPKLVDEERAFGHLFELAE